MNKISNNEIEKKIIIQNDLREKKITIKRIMINFFKKMR